MPQVLNPATMLAGTTAQPCLRKEAVEVNLCDNLSWVLVKEVMPNTTSV